MRKKNKLPDDRGYFGDFGGRFIPETLMPAVNELAKAYEKVSKSKSLRKSLTIIFRNMPEGPSLYILPKSLQKNLAGRKYT